MYLNLDLLVDGTWIFLWMELGSSRGWNLDLLVDGTWISVCFGVGAVTTGLLM